MTCQCANIYETQSNQLKSISFEIGESERGFFIMNDMQLITNFSVHQDGGDIEIDQ